MSRKACEGILRRAERRGRRLPEPLRSALIRQIGSGESVGAREPLTTVAALTQRVGGTGPDLTDAESGFVFSDEAKIVRVGGDFDNPYYKVDDRAFLAATPMSDRQMMVLEAAHVGDANRPNDVVEVSPTIDTGTRNGPIRNQGGLAIYEAPAEPAWARRLKARLYLGLVTKRSTPTAVTAVFRKSRRAQSVNDEETWVPDTKTNTLNVFDVGDTRATSAVVEGFYESGPGFVNPSDVAGTLATRDHKGTTTYLAFTCVPDDRNSGSGGIAVQYPIDVAPTLLSSEYRNAYDRGAKVVDCVALAFNQRDEPRMSTTGYALQASPGADEQLVLTGQPTVRRLTPGECQRLQGFPFDWNAEGLDEKGKPVELSDTQRYKQAGNAVTVNVSNWIAERLLPVIEEGR